MGAGHVRHAGGRAARAWPQRCGLGRRDAREARAPRPAPEHEGSAVSLVPTSERKPRTQWALARETDLEDT